MYSIHRNGDEGPSGSAPGQEEHQFKSPESIRSAEKDKSCQVVDDNPPKRRCPGSPGILPRLKPGNLALDLVAEEDENEDITGRNLNYEIY